MFQYIRLMQVYNLNIQQQQQQQSITVMLWCDITLNHRNTNMTETLNVLQVNKMLVISLSF